MTDLATYLDSLRGFYPADHAIAVNLAALADDLRAGAARPETIAAASSLVTELDPRGNAAIFIGRALAELAVQDKEGG